jgi:hypothetical protein
MKIPLDRFAGFAPVARFDYNLARRRASCPSLIPAIGARRRKPMVTQDF